MADHGFRTTGTHTGNFGRAKVKAGSTLSDLGMTSAEVVRAVKPSEYYDRLQRALESTQDPKLILFLQSELRKYNQQRGVNETRLSNKERTAPPYRTPGNNHD